jgi:hypothetical protein
VHKRPSERSAGEPFPGDRPLLGNGPHEAGERPGTGHGDSMGVLALGHEPSVTLTQPDLGFPPDVLDHLGWCVQAQWHMSADLGGGARGPGACDQDTAGRGRTSLGQRPLGTPRTRGIVCRDPPQAFHPFAWGSNPGESATCGHQSDGHRPWPTPESLEGGNHRRQAPRCALLVEGGFQTLEALGMCMHGADGCLQDDVLGRGGAEDCREPSEGGRPPLGPACGAASVSESAGLETARGGLESAEGVCTCPGEVAARFLFDLGDRARGEVPRAGQAGHWYRVPAVGVDAVAGFVGDQRGGAHPARVAFLGQRAGEPGATRAGVVDAEEGLGLRWHLADEVIKITLARAQSAEGHDRSAVLLRYRGYRARVLVDSHAAKACARLRPG